MKKKFPIALAILLLLCTALGCSAKSGSYPHDAEYDNGAAAYESSEYEMPDSPAEPASYGYENKTGASAPAPALNNRKIIRNADMNVETLQFDAFVDQLSVSIGSFGGYIESSSVGNRGYRNGQQLRYARYTIRIPAERLDDFLNTVSGLGNVTELNTRLKDVTTNYVDSEKHLESLRIEQQALMDILAKAETVEDIITVQDRLTYVRYEIESYEAILRTYDDQIALSTVNLMVSEVERETQVVEETFGQEVSRRFGESLQDVGNGFKRFGAWFLGNAPVIIVTLLIVGGIVLAIIFSIRGMVRHSEKKQKKRAADKEAAAAKEAEANANESEQK